MEGGGSAWVEFADPAVATAAAKSLHGMDAVTVPVRPEDHAEKAAVQVVLYGGALPPVAVSQEVGGDDGRAAMDGAAGGPDSMAQGGDDMSGGGPSSASAVPHPAEGQSAAAAGVTIDDVPAPEVAAVVDDGAVEAVDDLTS